MPFSARAGGHSYGGYSTSTGLVIDVTRLAGVEPQPTSTALVGAGARLVDVYSTLGRRETWHFRVVHAPRSGSADWL